MADSQKALREKGNDEGKLLGKVCNLELPLICWSLVYMAGVCRYSGP